MSSNGVPIQEISDTVCHKSIHVTETVCRPDLFDQELQPLAQVVTCGFAR